MYFQPPLNCTSARVDAHYDREGKDNFTNVEIYYSLYVDAGKSPSNSFLQLIADNEGVVDAGKTLSFSVKTTEPLSVITYQVQIDYKIISTKIYFCHTIYGILFSTNFFHILKMF